MKCLAIHATKNTHKPDATGAFIPEAIRFQRMHGGAREGFDNKLDKHRCRLEVQSILSRHSELDVIAFFGHGHRNALQSGHDMATVDALAGAIAKASNPRVIVYLAACSTAKEISVARGAFADALREALTKRGKSGHVDAHTTAGHSTWNPNVQRFDMGDAFTETVGDWIVSPDDRLWRPWVRALKGDLRLRYPLMTRDEIRASL
jgi:hypothetical protein